jgi:hypothetical protein
MVEGVAGTLLRKFEATSTEKDQLALGLELQKIFIENAPSIPHALDEAVERGIRADQARPGDARGRRDQAVHRIADADQGAELHRLLDVEGQDRVPGVAGQRFEHLPYADAKPAALVQECHFHETDRGHVAQRAAGIGPGERPPRPLAETSGLGAR